MKQILIKADHNDADYVQKISPISEEEAMIIKQVITKLLPFRNTERWNKGIEYGTEEVGEDRKNSEYYVEEGILTENECEILEKYLPDGDEDYPGIHTIVQVQILDEIETIFA